MNRVRESELLYNDEDGLYYYEGVPFTGTSFTETSGGQIDSEGEWRGGLEWGIVKVWNRSGLLTLEAYMAGGTLNGSRRQWHGNGHLATEELFEHGICLARKQWDESGLLIEDYKLVEGSPDFRTLERFRRADIGRQRGSVPM